MATITHTAALPHFRVPAFVETIRTYFVQRKLYRETVRELSSLSDRQLVDLGLSRSMLHRVAYQAAYES